MNAWEIVDVEAIIKNEIANGLCQKEIAKIYALALKSSYETDWARVNEAIVERWSVAGLKRIKELAWTGRAFNAQ